MRTPTVNEFKRWAKQNRPLAVNALNARAHAELERERVAAYIRPVFESFTWPAGMDGHAITGHKDIYLCEDEELCRRYFDACDAAHRLHGFTGPKDHCPALVAESEQIQAENLLLREGCALMGIERESLFGDLRARFLETLLGACTIGAREAAKLAAG